MKIINKKEDGSAISYTCYLVVIMIVCIIFVISTFRVDLFLLENTLNNALHIAESSATGTNVNSSGYVIDDKNLNKLKIITASDTTTNSITTYEVAQLKLVYNNFISTLSEQLCLNGSTPTKGIIYNKGGSEAKVKVKNVIIYEPLYTATITKEDNPNPDPEQDPYIEKDYIFTMLYDINPSKWIKYVIETNDDNTYKIASKSILNSPPILYDGRNAEGATIQATLNCEFKGVKEIFTTKTPTPYKISVTQANDIVIANIDNRKK